MAKGGLFAVTTAPMADEDDDMDDVDADAAPVDEGMPEPELGAGPFDAYAETIFSDADTVTKADALRQAILTILEEREMGGG